METMEIAGYKVRGLAKLTGVDKETISSWRTGRAQQTVPCPFPVNRIESGTGL
jgi:hypothetical protein